MHHRNAQLKTFQLTDIGLISYFREFHSRWKRRYSDKAEWNGVERRFKLDKSGQQRWRVRARVWGTCPCTPWARLWSCVKFREQRRNITYFRRQMAASIKWRCKNALFRTWFPWPGGFIHLFTYIIITMTLIGSFVNFLADLNRYFVPDECF